jgi:hypothetical protein
MSTIIILHKSAKNFGSGWSPMTILARGFLNGWSNFDASTQQAIAFTAIGNTVFFGGRAKRSGNTISGSENICNIPIGFDADLTMGGAVGFIDGGLDLQLCNFGIIDNGVDVGTLGIYKKIAGSIFVADFNGSYRSKSACGGIFGVSIGTTDKMSILVPQNFSFYNQNKVCFYHHGSGDDFISHISSPESPTSTSKLMRSTILALLADGWVVASINGGAIQENWGNPASATASSNAIAILEKTMNISKITCIGQSMGGLSSLRMLQHSSVSRWYGIYPVCNLDYAYSSSAFQSLVLSAFGGQSNYDASKAVCNPLGFKISDFVGKKLRSSASSGDTLVSRSQNSDALLSMVGTELMSIDTHVGNHGDISAFLPTTIVSHLNG